MGKKADHRNLPSEIYGIVYFTWHWDLGCKG